MTARTEVDVWLVVSDVDDTLTGDRDALFRLWSVLRDAEEPIRFVLNSSRPARSVDETIRDYFPQDFCPDAIITGLGTEIRIGGALLTEWAARFESWPRQEIVDLVEDFGHAPHPDVFQTPAKRASLCRMRGRWRGFWRYFLSAVCRFVPFIPEQAISI